MNPLRPVTPVWNALVAGLATTVLLWVGWFILHHPAIGLQPSASGPVLVGVFFVGLSVFSARWVRGTLSTGQAAVSTAIAALFSGLINLAAMGSMLVPQSDPAKGMEAAASAPADHPSLALMLGGYLGACIVLGLIAGAVVAALVRPRESAPTAVDLLRRAAFCTLAATLPLLLVGGLVTSYRAGLAVPDWPGTYRGNMFLYPISLMASDKQVYLEHSHRLFGTLVGMTCILVSVLAWRFEDRRWVKFWAFAILGLVIVQGLLGGFRVTEQSKWLAMGHGVLAQVVFLFMAMFAGYVTASYRAGPTTAERNDRRRRGMSTGIVHALILQLIFGAMYRHTGSAHALYTHIGFSFIVAMLGMVAGMASSSRPGPADAFNTTVRRAGSLVAAAVILQFILGWGAWAANPPGDFKPVPKHDELANLPPVPAWKAALRTAHQGNGAILIGSAGFLFVFARRPRRGEEGAAVPTTADQPPSLSAAAQP